MARAPRRTRKEVIQSNLAMLDEKKAEYQKKIDDIEAKKADLQAELDGIDAAAAKAAEQETLKELLDIMKKNGLTAADLKVALENKEQGSEE